jgi:spore coat protein U-like protein
MITLPTFQTVKNITCLILRPSLFISLILASLALFSEVAQAGTQNANMQSSAILGSTCSISAMTVNFGDLSQKTASPQIVSETETFQALCTKGTAYTIQIDDGANTSGNNRYMIGANSGNLIQYGICYTNVVSVSPWSCESGSDSWNPTVPAHAFTGTGTTQSINAYVFSPTGYYVPDTYSDTTTATLSF